MENHHRIQHIRASLDAKCHLKQTVLNFCTKFAQKRYFCPKRKCQHHRRPQHIQVSPNAKFPLNQTILTL